MFDPLIRWLQGVRLTRRSLVRMAVSIVGGFVLLSVLLDALFPRPLSPHALYLEARRGPAAAERFLLDALPRHPEDAEAWRTLARLRSAVISGGEFTARGMEGLESLGIDPASLPREAREPSDLDDAEFDAFLATCPVVPVEILRAIRDRHDPDRALEHLRPLGDSPGALLTAGRILRDSGRLLEARDRFDRARDIVPENEEAVTGWFEVLESLGLESELRAAVEDPELRRVLDPRALADYYLDRRDYLHGIPALWRAEYRGRGALLWFTSLGIAACWALFCFHLGFGWRWRRTIQALAPLAFLLGWLSGDLTLAAVVVTDDWVGKDIHSGLSFSILYALLIGFREEIIKILLFLPLVPALVRIATGTQAVVLASLVGLGFAANENINYYLSSGGHGILSRYLTANFFHLALTGYAGYYLVSAVRRKGEAWGEFYGALLQVIVFHAAYDLFLIEPSLAEYGVVSIILFVVLSQRYLRLVFHVRPHRIHRVSLTRIFVAALASATGMHYLYLSMRIGIAAGLWQTIGGLLGVAILTFLYFREFDERVA